MKFQKHITITDGTIYFISTMNESAEVERNAPVDEK